LVIKTISKVNGGIVVLDPFTGDVKALAGGLIINQVNLIELLKLKDNLVLHLNQLFMLLP
jgi:hypothetical protein